LHCAGRDGGAMLRHSDQYRGLEYVYAQRADSPGATVYAEPSPDYFQYVDLGGPGLTPVGYGYRSIEAIVKAAIRVNDEGAGVLEEIDREGIIATAGNSSYNESVIEAARKSIVSGGREVAIA